MSGPKCRPNHHLLWVSLALCAPTSESTGSGPETQTVLLSLNQGCFPVPRPRIFNISCSKNTGTRFSVLLFTRRTSIFHGLSYYESALRDPEVLVFGLRNVTWKKIPSSLSPWPAGWVRLYIHLLLGVWISHFVHTVITFRYTCPNKNNLTHTSCG